MTFDGLPKGHYGAILADPPWAYETWDGNKENLPARACVTPYKTMTVDKICALNVAELAAKDCCLFLWITWPTLLDAIKVIEAWGFKYKTCGFAWIKANATQIEFFQDDLKTQWGLGFWTRSNSEVCLLATKGRPKRVNDDVRQAIVAPRRQHSRKPEGVHASIQRLVAGPYIELFARQRRPGWDVWGNQTDKFMEAAE